MVSCGVRESCVWLVLGCSSETDQRVGLIHTLRMPCFSWQLSALVTQITPYKVTAGITYVRSGHRMDFYHSCPQFNEDIK